MKSKLQEKPYSTTFGVDSLAFGCVGDCLRAISKESARKTAESTPAKQATFFMKIFPL